MTTQMAFPMASYLRQPRGNYSMTNPDDNTGCQLYMSTKMTTPMRTINDNTDNYVDIPELG
jgi:hypothetical protein